MSPLTIQGKEWPLAKIFSNDFVFNVPNYQRPYLWTTEQAGELLSDSLEALGNSTGSVDDLNPYFLGSTVLIKGENPEAHIVDGQQRLVTLTILLSAIRTFLPQKEADSITAMLYEKENPILGTPNRYRLKIRPRDVEVFQKYIQDEDGLSKIEDLSNESSDSIKNIYHNARLFLGRLESLTQEECIRLVQFMAKRCFMVVVSTPDPNSAYRVFSILNDRGLDLSYTDILKAELIGEIGRHDEEKYTKKWEDIEEQLGRDSFKDLFAHIRMIYTKSKLRGTVLQEIRDHAPIKHPKTFIDEILQPMGEAFDQIKNASYESTTRADTINRLLTYLKRIDNFDWQPPAILYLMRNGNNPQEIERFFQDLERLASGMMIIRADVNYRLERYGRLLTAIEDGKDLYADDSPLQLTTVEQITAFAILDGGIYDFVKIRLPVLLRLDEALSGGEASYDYPIITVEHVLPQSPSQGSKWLEWWPEEQTRSKYLHRLGNLALLSRRKNSQAQNFEFERKKNEYFCHGGVSRYALTTQVLNEKEWTPQVVEARQKLLIDTLRKVWRLQI